MKPLISNPLTGFPLAVNLLVVNPVDVKLPALKLLARKLLIGDPLTGFPLAVNLPAGNAVHVSCILRRVRNLLINRAGAALLALSLLPGAQAAPSAYWPGKVTPATQTLKVERVGADAEMRRVFGLPGQVQARLGVKFTGLSEGKIIAACVQTARAIPALRGATLATGGDTEPPLVLYVPDDRVYVSNLMVSAAGREKMIGCVTLVSGTLASGVLWTQVNSAPW